MSVLEAKVIRTYKEALDIVCLGNWASIDVIAIAPQNSVTSANVQSVGL